MINLFDKLNFTVKKKNSSEKVFCIGKNKTGTTSIGKALETLGFKLGDQATAERLIEHWAKRNFDTIIKYCETADAFQDIPFSLEYTYQVLDYAFPNAKFILTIRNSPELWFESLKRFHTNRLGKGRLPTADDHKNDLYCYKGFLWVAHSLNYGIDESMIYNKEHYMKCYQEYNKRVMDYFKYRPNDLLILNVSEEAAMEVLCNFLKIKYNGQKMPHLNKS